MNILRQKITRISTLLVRKRNLNQYDAILRRMGRARLRA